jgi:BirA family biotin operon repressor/biotin-[acetyl-CoA-carboxylase] ligase
LDFAGEVMDTPYSVEVEETGSTQDLARTTLLARRVGPVLAIAARQTAGRGRRRSVWENAPRALAASLAFTPGWPPGSWGRLPLLAGLAAVRALAGRAPGARLKWPNDLLVGAAKVGGILVEGSDGLVVAGLGLNLWWPGAPPGYGAVSDADPGPSAGPGLARSWAGELLALAAGGPESWPRDEYRRVSATLGEEVTWASEDGSGTRRRGRAVDVAADGGLVVQTIEGREVLRSGEVHHLRARGDVRAGSHPAAGR